MLILQISSIGKTILAYLLLYLALERIGDFPIPAGGQHTLNLKILVMVAFALSLIAVLIACGGTALAAKTGGSANPDPLRFAITTAFATVALLTSMGLLGLLFLPL